MGWPLIMTLGTTIASDPGDPLLNAAILAWNATHVPWTDAWYQFPIFYPTRDALTLSEHLLGLSLIATPLNWVTSNPAIAYNLTLLLTYPLCGLAMYALVWRLTRSSSAAFISGVAFAFTPYRTSQLPHIQMLAVFWAPLALLGLHVFAESAGRPAAGPFPQLAGIPPESARNPGGAAGGPRNRLLWLALFAACWALQGAANGYLLVFFSVLVGAWCVWFLGAQGRWRDAALVAAAAVVAVLPLVPILARYIAAHRDLGLSRNLGEISAFSADLAAPLCAAATLTFWGWMRAACAPEGELFPGLALSALCAAGILLPKLRKARGAEFLFPRFRASAVRGVVRGMALALASLFVAVAVSVWFVGPWRLDTGWLRASASSADKPLSTALALLLVAALLSDRLWSAVRSGSMLTFYAAAALGCWVLSWGPFPRLFGVPVLYQAPYAWLLQLPGVDALRAPARFWMLTVLCLSVVAGLTMAQLLRGRNRRSAIALVTLVSAGLLVDGWTTIPAATVPSPVTNAPTLRTAPVLVAPAGELFRDAAIVYQAVAGGWTAINGYSGYEPGYYEALRTLSHQGSAAQYEPFLQRGDINLVEAGGVRRLAARGGPARLADPSGQRIDVTNAAASCSSSEVRFAIDADVDSLWICGIQDAEHHLTIDVGTAQDVGAVVYALGSAGAAFPRHLVIETSPDAARWDAAWDGTVAAMVLSAAMHEPRETRVMIPFTSRAARYVRLRQTGRDERTYWAVAEFEVWSR